MITFKTYAERMQHPQARLIPESMWNDGTLFDCSLPDIMLPLMTASNEELITRLNNSAPTLSLFKLKKLAWLSIALSHPDLELLTLREIATQLHLDSTTLFQLLAIMGNKKHLDEFLNESLNPSVQELIQAKSFSAAYRYAAANGHIGILDYLESKAPDQVQAMIQADDFYAYRNAAFNGHLGVLEHLESKAPEQIQAMIQANKFSAYRYAAANGHLGVLDYLESKAPDQIQAMIQADNFSAYWNAATNGHLGVLEHLESKAPDQIQAMIQAYNFSAYRNAAENGHLGVLEHLESKAPDQIQAMIQADNFYCLSECCFKRSSWGIRAPGIKSP